MFQAVSQPGDRRHAHVEIVFDRLHQIRDVLVEEVIGALDFHLRDLDPALRIQPVDELLHVRLRRNLIIAPVHDQPGGRAGCQEREVIDVGRRRDGNERVDLRSPHQQLHSDPSTERKPGHPARLRARVHHLQPIERRRRIRQFADPAVENALAAPDPAEIEPQHRTAPPLKAIEQLIRHAIVHRAAVLRVRVQDQRDRRRLVFLVLVLPFQAA
jgi:hypothetical protein